MADFEPLTPHTFGRHAHKDGANGPTTNGPFGYFSANKDKDGHTHGYSFGAGLMSGRIGKNNDAFGDMLAAQAHFGGWRGDDGKTNYGIEGNAAFAKVGMPLGNAHMPWGTGWDVGVATANANAKINDETASIGAQANLLEGSATFGNQEHNIRGGLSLGVGLAGRVHYGDADNDGVPEIGFGGDFLMFSGDIKSELLGHVYNWATKDAGRQASDVWDGITSGRYAGWAGDQAAGAWDGITSGRAANWVGDKAGQAWDAVTSW